MEEDNSKTKLSYFTTHKKKDTSEVRLAGKVNFYNYVNEKESMLFTLMRIELMNLSDIEKDILFIAYQDRRENSREISKDEIVRTLQYYINSVNIGEGRVCPLNGYESVSSLIKSKIDKIKAVDPNEFINIVTNLINRIENNEIKL